VDYRDHLTLLVLRGGDEGTMIGGAQYSRIDEGRAEIGISVADEWQGGGRGNRLDPPRPAGPGGRRTRRDDPRRRGPPREPRDDRGLQGKWVPPVDPSPSGGHRGRAPSVPHRGCDAT